MDATDSQSLAFSRHSATQNTEKRDRLTELYADIVPQIAGSVVQRMPRSIERSDLEQQGRLALLEIAPEVERYVRRRIFGAMHDSIRGKGYREATHACLDDIAEPADELPDIETQLMEQEQKSRLKEAVAALPPRQSEVILARFGEQGSSKRGRPRNHTREESRVMAGLRTQLLARAA